MLSRKAHSDLRNCPNFMALLTDLVKAVWTRSNLQFISPFTSADR